MRNPEDLSGLLVTCTGNTGRSPVLTGELVPVDWHGLPVQVTNGPDRSSEVLIVLDRNHSPFTPPLPDTVGVDTHRPALTTCPTLGLVAS